MKRIIKFWLRNNEKILSWIFFPFAYGTLLYTLYLLASDDSRWTMVLAWELILIVGFLTTRKNPQAHPTLRVIAFLGLWMLFLERSHLGEILLLNLAISAGIGFLLVVILIWRLLQVLARVLARGMVFLSSVLAPLFRKPSQKLSSIFQEAREEIENEKNSRQD